MDKCACKGSFLDKFIQPSILIYLNQEKMHGFSLIKKLKESEIVDYSDIDPAGLYRTLKRMEESGLLRSSWEKEEKAPPKRVYEITNEGRECLKSWGYTLLDYNKKIENLADAIKQSLGKE